MIEVKDGPCTCCSGRGRLIVRVNLGRRADVPCPRCSGSGMIPRCARCRDDEPETHVCQLVCGAELAGPELEEGSPPRLCLAPVLGAVTLGESSWARCEDHGGLDAADDVRRAAMQGMRATARLGYLPSPEAWPDAPPPDAVTRSAELDATARDLFERAGPAEPPPASPATKCADCGQRTDAGPCPLCGKVVCQLCAEREGESCCPPAPAPELVPGVSTAAAAAKLMEPSPAPPITSNKRRRKKPPTSAPAIARRRRRPIAPELPGMPEHHDVSWCGCDRCWERDA